MKIAVLLTCFNRKDKTLSCLASLFEAALPLDCQLKVFLVDDASTDGTAEEVAINFPNVSVIKGTGSLYWNRGMLLAWQTASQQDDYDHYLWLNDDVILYSSAILMLVRSASVAEGSIICGSLQSAVDGSITYGGGIPGNGKLEPNGTIQPCIEFNGNVVLIPRIVFKSIGVLDSVFIHAIGDYDYALRAYQNGISANVAPYYVGTCENHKSLPNWCLPSQPLISRLKSLYSPLGSSHPKYFFIYVKRHFGVVAAVKSFLTIHVRVLLPALWKEKITYFK